MFELSKKRWQWAAMMFMAFVWGASFILMKRGLDALTYIQVAALRIFISFILLLPLAIKNLKLVNRKNFLPLLGCGLIGNFFPAFLFTLSETQISSSLAGILNSLTPFFTVIAGVWLFKHKPNKFQITGVIIGFIGAALLITNGKFNSFGHINVYALFVVLATFFYGINSNLIRFKLVGLNGIQITSLIFFFIGPLAGIILPFTNFTAAFQSPYFWSSMLATFTLAAFGSVITLFVFNNLIHYTSAIFASSVTYIIPFFALVWGIIDGEHIGVIHITAMIIILIGVYLSSLKRKPKIL
ncbi:DMT family transporter [Tenuifilum thalassicum]|uniref:DMT family transporter n=1 Tax=Tenuifilum thalassicum TaxID=2590900 RepID=A0A7D3XEL5_9BACT|nr:DMT family transporter [Tenuifilum thalassicum]QKG80352.1 DMT family transporter [Tenuifilum thalassicum]